MKMNLSSEELLLSFFHSEAKQLAASSQEVSDQAVFLSGFFGRHPS